MYVHIANAQELLVGVAVANSVGSQTQENNESTAHMGVHLTFKTASKHPSPVAISL